MFFTKQSKTRVLMLLLKKAENDLDRAQKTVTKLTDRSHQIQIDITANYNLHGKVHRGERKKLLRIMNEVTLEFKKADCSVVECKRTLEDTLKALHDHVKKVVMVPKEHFERASVRSKNRKYFNVRFAETTCEYPRNYGDYDLHKKTEKIICNHKYVAPEPQQKHICRCRTEYAARKCSQN